MGKLRITESEVREGNEGTMGYGSGKQGTGTRLGTPTPLSRHRLWKPLIHFILALSVFLLCLFGGFRAYVWATSDVGSAPTLSPSANPAFTLDTEQPLEAEETGLVKILGSLFDDRSSTMDIVLLMTILSLVPSIVVMFTSFTRIIIVLSFVRQAMGTQQAPPNQVLVALALFLTFFIMQPIIAEIKDTAYDPYVAETITRTEAVDRTLKPLRAFMLRQTRTDDLQVFISYSNHTDVTDLDAIPTYVLLPAFLTSEIKTALTMGFFIYIPFIVLDMVVASTLMSMGMMMLPPAMISLPFKLLLFVSVDGWMLTVKTLMSSFR